MGEIQVTALEEGAYRVKVSDGEAVTDHRVTVPQDMLKDLGLTGADHEKIVRESFAFLLEREPGTSILSEFSLDQIARYFPEYYEELPRRLSG